MVVIGTHHYKGVIDFFIDFMKIKVLVAIIFNNGNRPCLLLAVKALCALN